MPHFNKGNVEIALTLQEIRNLYETLDPKTQFEAQSTLEAVERKLTFLEQLGLFVGRLRNLSFLKQDPKI